MNKIPATLILIIAGTSCPLYAQSANQNTQGSVQNVQGSRHTITGSAKTLITAARARTQKKEVYDGAYKVIAYPNGDVADNVGVCTDLIIRAYRAINIDLQQLVHEDMRSHFSQYPSRWNLKKPDSNIDHRRVPNLQRFFERQGASLPVSRNPEDYKPGDIVTWVLPGNLPHIGLVSDQSAAGTGRPIVLHNIGAGPVEEDALFTYTITGHYRFGIEAPTSAQK